MGLFHRASRLQHFSIIIGLTICGALGMVLGWYFLDRPEPSRENRDWHQLLAEMERIAQRHDSASLLSEGRIRMSPESDQLSYFFVYRTPNGDELSFYASQKTLTSSISAPELVNITKYEPLSNEGLLMLTMNNSYTLTHDPLVGYRQIRPLLDQFSATTGKPCLPSILLFGYNEAIQAYQRPRVWAVSCSNAPQMIRIVLDPQTLTILDTKTTE